VRRTIFFIGRKREQHGRSRTAEEPAKHHLAPEEQLASHGDYILSGTEGGGRSRKNTASENKKASSPDNRNETERRYTDVCGEVYFLESTDLKRLVTYHDCIFSKVDESCRRTLHLCNRNSLPLYMRGAGKAHAFRMCGDGSQEKSCHRTGPE